MRPEQASDILWYCEVFGMGHLQISEHFVEFGHYV